VNDQALAAALDELEAMVADGRLGAEHVSQALQLLLQRRVRPLIFSRFSDGWRVDFVLLGTALTRWPDDSPLHLPLGHEGSSGY
jgi:hypothetical protein